MKKYIVLSFAVLIFSFCNSQNPKEFSEKANNEIVHSLKDKTTTFQEVIHQYKGKKVLIDVWASWCSDCIRGLPGVKNLQKEYPEVVFLFLSVDTNKSAWKKGIERFNIKGEHYNLPKGMGEGDFVKFLNLNWIPRYLVIDENGSITLFNAIKATDENIKKALN